MNFIVLDFSGADTLWNLHEYLMEAFSLPAYYGHNMDALWDCLHCAFYEPTTIVLRNISAIPKELKKSTKIMLELFEDLEKEDQEVTVQVEETDNTYVNISDFMIAWDR